MMNKYALIMMGAGCLLAAACQAASGPYGTRPESAGRGFRGGPVLRGPADQQDRKAQEHRRFKRLSLPLR